LTLALIVACVYILNLSLPPLIMCHLPPTCRIIYEAAASFKEAHFYHWYCCSPLFINTRSERETGRDKQTIKKD